ncbi:MAG: hypothetical protein SH817_07615 [Leptospira sp.]|nr:hypothetical protein [Leptospira sp.]
MQNTQGTEWKELVERKDEFLHILRILNHYYESGAKIKNPLYQFRKDLVELPPKSIRIFLASIGKFEYFVQASKTPDLENRESWVHIDGISEERMRLRELGNLDHPVFSITCLGDLYENHCVSFKFPEEREKKVAKPKKKIRI